jgi:hypothetical protein
MNAALHAPLQGRAYAAPAPASQSWLVESGLLNPLLAIVTPRIQAVLHLSRVIDIMESPIPQRRENYDRDDGGDIAAPARMRLGVGAVRR